MYANFEWLNPLLYYFSSAAGGIFENLSVFSQIRTNIDNFFDRMTHLCTQFQKLNPPMYAHFGFQTLPSLDPLRNLTLNQNNFIETWNVDYDFKDYHMLCIDIV